MFAVIPTATLGGALAILGTFFPALMGGAKRLISRWTAWITIVSLNGTLCFLYGWLGSYLSGTPLEKLSVFWGLMTALTIAGTIWAWNRQMKWVTSDSEKSAHEETAQQAKAQTTETNATEVGISKVERRTLWITTILCLGLALGMAWFQDLTLRHQYPGWRFLLTMTAGVTVGSVVLLIRSRKSARSGLSTEGIILTTMVVIAVGFNTADSSSQLQKRGKAVAIIESSSGAFQVAVNKEPVWQFVANEPGEISSTPLVTDKNLFVGINHGIDVVRKAKVYCLDLTKDPEKENIIEWEFDADGTLAQMFSSPRLAEGRLYFGEGFHQDQGCRLFCLDATTGKEIWNFQTNSHTESTPCIANGKVYFGAGDDGVYCINAKDGKLKWQFPEKADARNGLHVDSTPTIVGNRMYCSSGVSRLFQRQAVFCVDATTGKEIWTRDDLDLPAWGSPNVQEGRVFVGLGNGRLTISDPEPKGAVICLKAQDGSRLWKFDRMKDAVHCQPVVDEHFAYVVSRDGNAYALEKVSGRLRWTHALGGPAVARPALAQCTHCQKSNSLYLASINGHVHCVDPATGKLLWRDEDWTQVLPEIVAGLQLQIEPDPKGDRRRLFVAAGVNGRITAVIKCVEDRVQEK